VEPLLAAWNRGCFGGKFAAARAGIAVVWSEMVPDDGDLLFRDAAQGAGRPVSMLYLRRGDFFRCGEYGWLSRGGKRPARLDLFARVHA
jgi:hypothetical protein